jgi:glycosyltransferase A (GT-A) superfamily protein (DUF2064 family)
VPSALVIMTRSTSDPRIKAAFAPRLPAEQDRRDLALAFIDDLLERVAQLPNVRVRIAVTPPAEALRVHRPSLPSDMFLVQRGTALAERQQNVLHDLAASGFDRLILMGADVPDLPPGRLEQAFAALDASAPVAVIGPTDSGACHLIGVNVTGGKVLDMLGPVRWATPFAADDATAAAAREGVTVRRLDTWNTIGNPEDLGLLSDRLRYAPEAAPHTAAFLRRLKLF